MNVDFDFEQPYKGERINSGFDFDFQYIISAGFFHFSDLTHFLSRVELVFIHSA